MFIFCSKNYFYLSIKNLKNSIIFSLGLFFYLFHFNSYRNHCWVSFSGFSTSYNEAFGRFADEEGKYTCMFGHVYITLHVHWIDRLYIKLLII